MKNKNNRYEKRKRMEISFEISELIENYCNGCSINPNCRGCEINSKLYELGQELTGDVKNKHKTPKITKGWYTQQKKTGLTDQQIADNNNISLSTLASKKKNWTFNKKPLITKEEYLQEKQKKWNDEKISLNYNITRSQLRYRKKKWGLSGKRIGGD